MAADKISAMTRLSDITGCCICLKTFTDPRMLPCIHTFCFQCLKDLTDKSDKKPGDTLPCPVCRQEFIIPDDGVQGIQKNFFLARMIEVQNAFIQSKVATSCDVCKANTDAIEKSNSKAAFRCLDCQENFCEGCNKMHQAFKLSRNHKTFPIFGTVGEEEAVKTLNVKNCDIHRGKILDYYCAECRKVVCVSCFVECHRTHECSDINTVEEEFRQMIKINADKISTLAGELLTTRDRSENKENFLKKIAIKELEILKKSEELKVMIDEHAKSLLSSLDEIRNRRLKEYQTKEDELERRITILESFSRYCNELRSKGSASDVCRNKDELLRRADELEEDHEVYILSPNTSFEVTFQTTDLKKFLKTTHGNMIGSLKEPSECFEDFVVIIGEAASRLYSYKMNLHHANEISPIAESDARKSCPSAAVYNNTMFITGFGEAINEIWKYNFASGWTKCGTLVQGRQHHCAEFIGETLYICGGSENYTVMDSIESYNALTENSAVVGQLKYGAMFAACVAFKGSIYVFGGLGKNTSLDCVQAFNPAERTCTLLSTSSRGPSGHLQAVSWGAYAILLDCGEFCIYDFEGNTWQRRSDFVQNFNRCYLGMILYKERLFMIDGMRSGTEDNVMYTRIASILNNERPNWKPYGRFPKQFYVMATAQLSSIRLSN